MQTGQLRLEVGMQSVLSGSWARLGENLTNGCCIYITYSTSLAYKLGLSYYPGEAFERLFDMPEKLNPSHSRAQNITSNTKA